jgi:predicted enzyme related to lactoylglutathione lyase
MIRSIAFTIYPVSDIERAKAFYRDVVGLNEPSTLHEAWVEFDVGGGTFALATGGEKLGIPPGSAFAVAFETDDVNAAFERLRASGANVDPVFESPFCHACFARDPDGNRFTLHQLKA